MYFLLLLYTIILVSIWKGLLISDQLLYHKYAPLNLTPEKSGVGALTLNQATTGKIFALRGILR
jgi:hypothetical protein